MKKILRIAKIELSTMFYSPIAWFILIVFIIQAGMQYSDNMERLIRTQEIFENMSRPFTIALTNEIFYGRDWVLGLFKYIIEKLYLYIPLLTMGLISRETSSGTIKLLYSSPLKVRDLVLGKFMAMVIFSLLLVMILAGFGLTAMITVEAADYGQILSGLLGIFLLLCAYSAIGLFMSSLTTHQIVAALGTFVLFALLDYIRTVWQNVDFVRELTYYLAISGRINKMLLGLISTKDVLYFLLIISLFLVFTYLKVRSTRESKSPIVKFTRYIGAFSVVIVFVYLSSLQGWIGYLDTTRNKYNTISTNSQGIINKMNAGPIEVTSYINLLDRFWVHGTPKERMKDHDRWENYMRFKPDIKLKYEYYFDTSYGQGTPFEYDPDKTVDQLADKYARLYKVNLDRFNTPAEIRKVIDLSKERNRYVMHLKYNENSTFLRLFDDQRIFPSETETMAAFKRLTDRKFPKIGFLQGEGERDPVNSEGGKGYGLLTGEITNRWALINQGFDVETVRSDQEIPSHISCLVIADPRVTFSQKALTNIREFIDRGGNLWIAGEPGKQHILNPVLEPLGVQIKEGMLVQITKYFEPEMVLPNLTKMTASLSQAMANSAEDGNKIKMNTAAALTYQKGAFAIEPLLMSDSSTSWLKKSELSDSIILGPSTTGVINISIKGNTGNNETLADQLKVLFSESDGDERGTFPTGLALTRKINNKEQRIVVTGDADFISNEGARMISVEGIGTVNYSFIMASFKWLSQGEYPIDTQFPLPKDRRLNLTENQRSWLELFSIYVLPGAILIFATVLLIRRRNK